MTKTRQYTSSPARFSMEWWLESVRNSVFVVLVTLLVWVYADMDVAEDRSFRATAVLTTGGSQDVELLTAGEVEVKFSLRGTRRSLRSFQEQLDQHHGRIEYDVSVNYLPGSNSISFEDLVNQGEVLNRLNLSLITAAPSNINFILNQRVTERALVDLDYTGAKLTSDPIIEPSQVLLHLTQVDLDNIRRTLGEGQPIRLKTKQLNLAAAPAGQPHTEQVEVLPPPASFPVRLDPSRISVTFQIDQRTATQTLTVNVQAAAPSSWPEADGAWKDYVLVKKDPSEWRRQITVSGARKDVEKLKQEDPEAYVALTDHDKAPVAGWLTRTIEFRFPSGMDLQVLGEPAVVNFKLEKRLQALQPPPAPAPPLP